MSTLPSYPQEKLDEWKARYIELLRSTGREGIESLIQYLEEETDFFTAPASTKWHGAVYGGLLHHSLEVYKLLENFSKPLKDVSKETLILCALLHDICKTNMYVVRKRNVKVDGRWQEEESFAIEDQFPFGHGEKSVYLCMRHIQLTPEEALAIRWHMGGFDDTAKSGGYAISNAFDKYPIAVKLHLADLESTYLREKGTSSVNRR